MSDPSVPDTSSPAVGAFCEYLRQLELDPRADFEAWCAQRPELAPDLRRLRAEYERVTAILERLTPAASFSHRLRERYGASVDPGISLGGDAPRGGSGSGSGSGRGGGVSERLATLGSTTGRYEPRGEIARGGMGAILKVWDRELRRMLAMKVVLARRGEELDDSDADVGERRLSRFLEEAQITAQLDHPGIVPVHDLGLDSKGRVYFTMQLIDGRDLREVFELARREREGWTTTRVLWAMLRVCEAMAYAHSKGVVHRDLKPANVMVGRFGETYVMDWGLAKVVGREDLHDLRLTADEERPKAPEEGRRVVTDRSAWSAEDDDSPLRTLDGDVVGTPAYMSPEQALGRLSQVGPQSDVYAVGAMLYHLLSGHMPYEPLGERVPTTTVLEAVRSGAPWPLAKIAPDCNPELVAICAKAMAREPAERYPDMLSLSEDLRAYLEGRGVRAYETGVLYEFRKWVARNRAVAASLGALVLVGVLSIGVFIRQQQVSLARLTTANEQIESERQAALAAKQLAEQNARELAKESERLEAARRDALEKKELAEQNWQMALENAEMTRRQSYRAQILAADFSLNLEDVAVAKASLADTDPDLRGWEWSHLGLASEGATRQLLKVDTGLADVSISDDGRLLTTIGLDLVTRVVDVESGRVLHSLTTATFGGWSVANPSRLRAELSPRGGLALAAGQRDAILVYNAIDGTPLGQIPHAGAKTALVFSADGKRILSASDAGTALVFENTGVNIKALVQLGAEDGARHDGAVLCGALSPSGARALTGGADGTARVWDATSGRELARLPGDRTRAVTAVAWAPRPIGDEEHVAVAYDDGGIAVFDVRGLRLVTLLHGHARAARALCFAEDPRRLYSGGEDMTLRLWSLPSGRQERVFRGHDREVTGLALLEGGARVVSSSIDGTLRVWDPAWDPAVSVAPADGRLLGLGWSAGDRHLIACPERGAPRGWDLRSGLPDFLLDPPPPAPGGVSPELNQAMAVRADGAVLAVCGLDGWIRLRGLPDGELLAAFDGPSRRVSALALAPDGAWLAAGASDGNVWLWSLERDERPRVFEGHRREVLALAFSPEGDALASASRDRSLLLREVESGRLREFWPEAHPYAIGALAFTPDGERVLSAGADGHVRAWREGSRQAVLDYASQDAALTAIDCSPDGRRIVTGSDGGDLALWDAQTGDLLLYLDGHRGHVVDVRFSHDGLRIASVGVDDAGASELRVWESRPGAPRYAERRRELARRERARELALQLYRLHHFPAAALAALPDAVAEAELRAAVERELRLLAHDPAFLAERCLEVLLQPEAPPELCGAAREAAERVALLRGDDSGALAVLGAARVRDGDPERGLELLRDSDRRADGGGRVRRARNALFEALALAGLGRREEARSELDQTRELLARLDEAEADELEPLMELQPLLRALELELGSAE